MKFRDITAKRHLALLALLLALVLTAAGCGSEAENTSQRPWNSPEGWQNGNAGMMAPPH